MSRKMLIVFVNILPWLGIHFARHSIHSQSLYLVHYMELCAGQWCAYNYVAIRVVQTHTHIHWAVYTTQLKKKIKWERGWEKASRFFMSFLWNEGRRLINLFEIFQPLAVKAAPTKWITSKLSVLYSQSKCLVDCLLCWRNRIGEEREREKESRKKTSAGTHKRNSHSYLGRSIYAGILTKEKKNCWWIHAERMKRALRAMETSIFTIYIVQC